MFILWIVLFLYFCNYLELSAIIFINSFVGSLVFSIYLFQCSVENIGTLEFAIFSTFYLAIVKGSRDCKKHGEILNNKVLIRNT